MADLSTARPHNGPQFSTNVAVGQDWAEQAPLSTWEVADPGRCARLIREVRKGRNLMNLLGLHLLLIAAIGALIVGRAQSGANLSPLHTFRQALALSSSGILIVVLNWLRNHKYNRAMAALLEENHKHNLPVLIELVPYIRGRQAAAAKARLTRILLSIEPNDKVLTGCDIARLHSMLRWPDVALVCAILHAIETVGTLESLPAVTQLANGKLLARHTPAVRETAVLCMDTLKDKLAEASSIGAMLKLMGRRDSYAHLRTEARQSLILLLPGLTANDRHFLKTEERQLLYAILKTRDIQFIMVVLQLLPRVGLLDGIPHVTALASGKYPANRNLPLLRDQARACLALLGGRLNVLDSHNYLLRSSGMAPGNHTKLVRPLHGNNSAEPVQLLRPIYSVPE